MGLTAKGKGKGSGKKGVGRGPPAEESDLDRETQRMHWFASLPPAPTPAELALKAALREVATRLGPVRLSLVTQDPAVMQAKAALEMPKVVPLSHWIQQRIPEDFALVAGEHTSNEQILIAAGSIGDGDVLTAASGAEQVIEDFYASLPATEFTEEEIALHDAIVVAVQSLGGAARMSSLTRGELSKDIHHSRSALLPKGAPLQGWLERRMGSEIRLIQDERGGTTVELLPEVTPIRKGKGGGRSKLAGKGGCKPLAFGGKGKVGGGKPPREEDPAEAAAKEEFKLAREARSQEFLASLPMDRLSPMEESFREQLLAELHACAGQAARLSVLCAKPEFKAAKAAFLPPEVSVCAWIENRIGGDVVLQRDGANTYISLEASAAAAAAAAAAYRPPAPLEPHPRGGGDEADAAMAEYFSYLGPLQPQERKVQALLVQAAQRMGGAARLSDVFNSDSTLQAAWQGLKQLWLHSSPPAEVTLAKWVELRLGEEVKFTREPFIQVRGAANWAKRAAPPPPAWAPVKAPRLGGYNMAPDFYGGMMQPQMF